MDVGGKTVFPNIDWAYNYTKMNSFRFSVLKVIHKLNEGCQASSEPQF